MTEIALSVHETLRVVSEGPDTLTVEATWLPGSTPPLLHAHPRQDERFEIVEGELTLTVAGTTWVAVAGDAVDVPAGVSHSMHNDGPGAVKAVWSVSPPGRTLAMWKHVAGGHSPLRDLQLLWRFRDEFRLRRK